MRDLEIRGAGNILGPEQSGHIATVGYEMYCQLLEEATRQLKNEAKPQRPEAHVELGISAFLPKTYIPGDRQRMDLYRRLTRCDSFWRHWRVYRFQRSPRHDHILGAF